mgnify:CR=1 FL=1
MLDLVWWLALGLVLIFGGAALTGAPYVPSRRRDIKKAFSELYVLSKDDVLVDIGSGDGVVLREAARRGARAIGYEINPILVAISSWLSRKQPLVTVYLSNFWHSKLAADTTVVYLFGDGRDIKRIDKWLSTQAGRLNKSIFIISYGFKLPGRQPVRAAGAHFLYKVTPLHFKEP